MVTPGDIWEEFGGECGANFVGDLLTGEHLGDPVIVEHLGHVDADEEGVSDCPRLGTIAKNAEFERKRFALLLLGDVGVHATRIDFEIVLVGVAEVLDGVLGKVTESKDALLTVVGESRGAKDFAEFTRSITAAEVHLPKAVLSGDIALGKEEVVEVVSTDVRNSLLIADDLHWGAESGDRNGAIELGQSGTGGAKEPQAYANCRQQNYCQNDQQEAE